MHQDRGRTSGRSTAIEVRSGDAYIPRYSSRRSDLISVRLDGGARPALAEFQATGLSPSEAVQRGRVPASERLRLGRGEGHAHPDVRYGVIVQSNVLLRLSTVLVWPDHALETVSGQREPTSVVAAGCGR